MLRLRLTLEVQSIKYTWKVSSKLSRVGRWVHWLYSRALLHRAKLHSTSAKLDSTWCCSWLPCCDLFQSDVRHFSPCQAGRSAVDGMARSAVTKQVFYRDRCSLLLFYCTSLANFTSHSNALDTADRHYTGLVRTKTAVFYII